MSLLLTFLSSFFLFFQLVISSSSSLRTYTLGWQVGEFPNDGDCYISMSVLGDSGLWSQVLTIRTVDFYTSSGSWYYFNITDDVGSPVHTKLLTDTCEGFARLIEASVADSTGVYYEYELSWPISLGVTFEEGCHWFEIMFISQDIDYNHFGSSCQLTASPTLPTQSPISGTTTTLTPSIAPSMGYTTLKPSQVPAKAPQNTPSTRKC